MNYLSILNLKLIGELSEEMEGGDFFENVSGELKAAVSDVLKKYGMRVLTTDMMSHPLELTNFAQCRQCSSWFINRAQEKDREDVDESIKDGAIHESHPLCCDCLPENHQWSWKNIET